MTVRTTYCKGAGKTYALLSQSGSPIIQKVGRPPARRREEDQLKPGATRRMDARDCVALAITPRRKAPNMIDGELWINASNGSIVDIDGLNPASVRPWP